MTDDEYPWGEDPIIETEEWHANAMKQASFCDLKRACVCAVCAGRPCACNVAVLAEVLRDAAQIPRAAGVAIVGVRAVNKGERASD